MKNSFHLLILLPIASTGADVLRFKDESSYLTHLASEGYNLVTEDFEGSAWEGVRSNFPDNHYAASITSQRITWSSAGRDLWTYPGTAALISTNQNWGRNGTWGIYDNYLASTKRIVTPEPIYGLGFWVNTNPDLTDVGILFQDRATANEPGYMVTGYGAMYPGDIHPVGHAFIGFIDPDGFTEVIVTGTLEVDEDGVLEGATVFGADDFAFAVPASFIESPLDAWRGQHFTAAELDDPAREASLWGNAADPDADGLDNDSEFALGSDPRDGGDRGAISLERSPDGSLEIQFLRRNDSPGFSIVPEVSADLSTWNPGAVVIVSSIDQGDGYELVTAHSSPSPAPQGRQLFHLEITKP